MARIAFAWELGGELGHAMSCASLAIPLAMRGHRIAFIFRELRSTRFLRDSEGFDIYQAPVLTQEGRGSPIPASYPDILLGCGYSDATTLGALVAAWRANLERWKPDLVVEEFAPTALLAARGLGVPCVRFGNGFAIAPKAVPIPPFRFDEPVSATRLAQAEARALASVNEVQSRSAAAPLASLAEHFACAEEILCTFPELDQYGNRPAANYWGPRLQISTGARLEWPRGEGKRIIVYVKPALAQLDALIDILAASRHRVLAFIPDLDEGRRRRLAGPGRIVSTQPIRLDALIKDCDLLVSHGGSIAAGTLALGVPQLVFPTHYEQYLTARRVEQLVAGGWLGRDAGPHEVRRALDQVLGESRFLECARAFGRRYPGFSPAEQRRRMVLRVEELLAARILSRSSTPAGSER